MAYIVKYIKDFSDINKIKSVCRQDIMLGYKVAVFSKEENQCDINIENAQFFFCPKPMENAVLYAKKCFAEKCQFYMKVGGIYTVDPAIYKGAIKIKELDYDEFIELSVNGYKAIHPKVINLAKRNSVRLELLSLEDSVPTIVKEVVEVEGNIVKTMTKDPNIVVVTLTEIPDKKGVTYHIFKLLSDEEIYVDSIMLPAANHNQQDISFCIRAEDLKKTENILLNQKNKLEFKEIIVNQDTAKISVTGSGFQTRKGIAAKLLEVLFENDININMIFTSEVKISIVLSKSQADLAIKKIHENLIENR